MLKLGKVASWRGSKLNPGEFTGCVCRQGERGVTIQGDAVDAVLLIRRFGGIYV
jgi:hypothetical protein